MSCEYDTLFIGEDKEVTFKWLDVDGVTYLDLNGNTTRTASIGLASNMTKIYTVNGVLAVDNKSITFIFDGPTQTANLTAGEEYIIEISLAGSSDRKFQMTVVPQSVLEA